MSPGERAMPIIEATWVDDGRVRGWLIALPGDRRVLRADREMALRTIDAEAPGSAIRWTGPTATATMSPVVQTDDA